MSSRKEKNEKFENILISSRINNNCIPQLIIDNFGIDRRHEVIDALNKLPYERNDSDIKYIFNWLVRDVRNEFILKLHRKIIKQLCKKIRIEYIDAGQVVFAQGDLSNKLYCILNGSVDVWVSGEEDYNNNNQLEASEQLGIKVTTLGMRSTFGELGLMQSNGSQLRTATVVTCEVTEFLTIDKTDFDAVLATKFNVTNICDILRKFSLFSQVRPTILTVIALNTKRLVYKANRIIINENSKVKSLYLIVDGQCDVCRRSGNRLQSIARLNKGEMFGNITTNANIYLNTIQSVTPVILFSIRSDHLTKRLRADVLNIGKRLLQTQKILHQQLSNKMHTNSIAIMNEILTPRYQKKNYYQQQKNQQTTSYKTTTIINQSRIRTKKKKTENSIILPQMEAFSSRGRQKLLNLLHGKPQFTKKSSSIISSRQYITKNNVCKLPQAIPSTLAFRLNRI